ncbi:Pentatricopeptide repeat-containing protein, chloroplastic [Ananas comosus]|uniref:Pentatricopeptide repeat-containing protein, chloroplastic n=1 Tax=Ananas comosus TaxID=4615 RepID=A0A199UJV6_ANACO|nr:Pentatricopeptide repeat-containing protein, chloroplastic [Ananas comosus]
MSSGLQLAPAIRSLETWNRMLQSATRDGHFSETLHVYSCLLNSGLRGDAFTFPFVAKACAKLRSVRDGQKLHARTILMGFHSNTFVQTSLLDMYSKCSCISEARRLFDAMPHRSLISWNCMISAYCKESQIDESFSLFNEMRDVGVNPSGSTCVGLVSGCMGSILALRHGLPVHCYAMKVGLDNDLQFCNSIISMYAKLGRIGDVRFLFDSAKEKSIVTWTALAGGYAHVGDFTKVFHLFNQMRGVNTGLDSIAFVGLISAGTYSRNLLIAGSVHALVIETGFDQEGVVAASLINLYAKCGDLKSSQKVFDAVREKNVFLWTSMISGYVQVGDSDKAVAISHSLLTSTTKPNKVTILAILSACADFASQSIGGTVEEYVRANRFESDLQVVTGLIHVYCKCGDIERARKIFNGISNKDLTLWSTMIGGYATYGKGKEALSLFKEMQKDKSIEPDAIVFTHVLSACGHSGLVEEGLNCFNRMLLDYGVQPTMEHYMCIVDLLSKAGHIEHSLRFIHHLPIHVQNKMLAPMLSACRARDNSQLAELVLKQLLKAEIRDTGHYVVTANLCSFLGRWKEASSYRSLISQEGLVKEPGWSRIELSSSI